LPRKVEAATPVQGAVVDQKLFEVATEEDVYYCYRLFLQRKPDPTGWESWQKMVRGGQFSLQVLCDSFLYSDEFVTIEQQRSRPQLVNLEGFKIYARLNDAFVGSGIIRYKSYEANVTREVRSLLKPGHVFIDIGANIGYFTLLAATLVGPQGKVLAFEPNEDNCDLLKTSVRENGFENIEIYPYAVSECEQSLELVVAAPHSTGQVCDLAPGASTPAPGFRVVRAVALDDMLTDRERINVVKMDIDGAEPRALWGMERLIRRHRPVMLVEFAPDFLLSISQVTPETFLDQLAGYGYDLVVLDRSSDAKLTPQSKEEMMAIYARSGTKHIDLVCYPR
jgi:FkbM family methyltransferase